MASSRQRLEGYFNRLWYVQSKPGLHWCALSRVYQAATIGKQHRPQQYPPCPVIVVGNITVGGSGKTPVVAALARLLADSGFKPAIISRGYGGKGVARPLAVSSTTHPARCGDEPVLLARLTRIPVWVCRMRARALAAALDAGANCVISDDGLQNHALPRSFEICVIDGARGFGNGRLLPAGPLRQPLERLDEVDLLLAKSISGAASRNDLPGVAFRLESSGFHELGGTGKRSVDEMSEGVVDAVCGIAHPESFFATLEALGLTIRRHPRPDHHVFSTGELQQLPGPVVVTEKDAVKIERLSERPETWVLPVHAQLPDEITASVLTHVREFKPA